LVYQGKKLKLRQLLEEAQRVKEAEEQPVLKNDNDSKPLVASG
jgi:hypothetical protein